MEKWIELILLIIFSAFFSAAETALTTFNKIRMREKADQGSRAAALLLKMTDDKPKMLSAILIGNNIVNIAASALAATIAMSIGFNVGIMTLLLTLVILVFGEITPKRLALRYAEEGAPVCARLLWFWRTILSPFNFILRFTSRARDEMLAEALVRLREAKELHDELERYYVDAMDFAAVRDYTEKLLREIFEEA